MSGDKKYRQQGYRDTGGARREPPRPRQDTPRPQPASRDRPGGPAPLASRAVSRCAGCGTLLPPLAEPAAGCPQCGLALHSCRQCRHFDPGRRFECAEAVPERVADKSARNDCALFALRSAVERATATGGATRTEDARRAFDNLFER